MHEVDMKNAFNECMLGLGVHRLRVKSAKYAVKSHSDVGIKSYTTGFVTELLWKRIKRASLEYVMQHIKIIEWK